MLRAQGQGDLGGERWGRVDVCDVGRSRMGGWRQDERVVAELLLGSEAPETGPSGREFEDNVYKTLCRIYDCCANKYGLKISLYSVVERTRWSGKSSTCLILNN